MDEQRAIQLCLKHRDPVGFEFLVEKYRREAFGHAWAFLGNQDDALEACQDAFARAFVGITQVKELPRFYPWFYAILKNRCLNLIARRETSQRYSEREKHATDAEVDWLTPRAALERSEDQERVRKALASLKPEHREILVMKYVEERAYEEIATLLNIPRGSVMSRLYYARTALRNQYSSLDQAVCLSLPENVT